MLDILYFASFRELFGKAQEQLPAQFSTVADLINSLAERGENWRDILVDNPQVQIAVNQDIASRETAIKAGDEIAFFPPVTGG